MQIDTQIINVMAAYEPSIKSINTLMREFQNKYFWANQKKNCNIPQYYTFDEVQFIYSSN